jgi:uncharacterized protein YhfF
MPVGRPAWVAAMTPEAAACWARFKQAHPSLDDARLYEVFCFGDSQALADELGALVVAGTKRATASSLWALQAQGRPPPQPGDYSIVTTWAGQPLCVIETQAIEIVAFRDVGAEFAAAEGEGDGSLDFWRSAHAAYFTRECLRLQRCFDEGMPVVCERFEVAALCFADSRHES